ncbi:hypothetical protein [Desulfofundulus kuznetsovii]
MITVKDIIKKYPRGTKIDVWVRNWGGPSYLGRFAVEARTLRHVESGLKWGELAKDVTRDNHGMRLIIVRVKKVN